MKNVLNWFLAIALLGVNFLAHAEEWMPAGEGEAYRLYTKKSSLQRVKDGFRVWTLTDFTQPQKLPDGSITYSGLARFKINCVDETYVGERLIAYSAPMGKGSILIELDSPTQPQVITPDATVYHLVEKFCPKS